MKRTIGRLDFTCQKRAIVARHIGTYAQHVVGETHIVHGPVCFSRDSRSIVERRKVEFAVGVYIYEVVGISSDFETDTRVGSISAGNRCDIIGRGEVIAIVFRI